jgi:hypothetical protein
LQIHEIEDECLSYFITNLADIVRLPHDL